MLGLLLSQKLLLVELERRREERGKMRFAEMEDEIESTNYYTWIGAVGLSAT
jgi:hypothetical protein